MAAQHVIVIGGGSTGCACAHDLALRGFEVTLVERGELASGTTGRCSCLLHSGARYAVKDQESALEAIEENHIMRRILPPMAMEENDGLFILVGDDDPAYGDRFFEGCAQCGITATEIAPAELLRREPNLTHDMRRAAIVSDAVVETLRFTLAFAATAGMNGAHILRNTEVKEFLIEGDRVTGVQVQDRVNNQIHSIKGDMVVNAAGPWADRLASLAGINIPLSLSPGVHVMIGSRLTHMTVNRMRSPGSCDFVYPQRNHVILGTTSWTVQNCDYLYIPRDHINQLIQTTAEMIPVIAKLPIHSINAATRPLLGRPGASERDLSRTFKCFDHAERDNIEGFVTIAGGKMVTARIMAEKIGDLVCQKLGVAAPCQTRTFPLASYRRLYTG